MFNCMCHSFSQTANTSTGLLVCIANQTLFMPSEPASERKREGMPTILVRSVSLISRIIGVHATC